jgi:hypothetical protein
MFGCKTCVDFGLESPGKYYTILYYTQICNAPYFSYRSNRFRGAEQLRVSILLKDVTSGPVGCAETEPGWPGYSLTC